MRRRGRRGRTVGAALALTALAAGCSATAHGTPTQVTTSAAPEEPTAPPVHRALDVRAYLDHPCALLSPAALLVRVVTDQSPLSAAYTTDADHHELFEPLTILGYPAVAEAETVAERTN